MAGAVLLDLGGVLYDGERAVPGSVEAVERLKAAGIPLRCISNTTRSTKQALRQRLERLGVTISEDELFTPAQAARQWLSENGRTPYLLVHPNLDPEFDGLPPEGEVAVVVGDAGEAFTYERLNAAFRVLNDGADFLALAPNRVFKDADGRLSLDAGPFVRALEFASGKEALVLGKPAPPFFQAAAAATGCPPEEVVMIGDDAEFDIAGALRAGIGTALLVRTGKYREGDETRFDPPPTAVLDDLAAAVDWVLST
jgi:HAD superfamily hydrolase (TIGR01458 family)